MSDTTSGVGIRTEADRQRGAVYWAESQLARIMDRPPRKVRIGGAVLTLPEPRILGSLAHAQQYVDEVLARRGGPTGRAAPLEVVAKRGFRTATYQAGQIHIPTPDGRGRWALAEPVLLHEIAHHLARQAGGTGHGSQFRSELVTLYEQQLGASSARLLSQLFAPLDKVPEPAAPAEPAPVARRVGALLAKAEATDSEPEAQAFLTKATALAQRHSIDLAVAGAAGEVAPEVPTHRMIDIGPPRGAANKLLVSLLLRIANPWKVPVDIGPGSVYVLVFGLPKDLAEVERFFTTASTVMFTQADSHVRGGSWRGTKYYGGSTSAGPLPAKLVTARIARTAFCTGFVTRLGQLLAASARVTVAETVSLGAGAELALQRKDLVVKHYHQAVSSARGSWQGPTSTAATAKVSRTAGARAADSMQRSGVASGRQALTSS
ncbi:MAG: TIGR04338 family metallohydrolase [Candidatus Nanopelagicales bacterium]